MNRPQEIYSDEESNVQTYLDSGRRTDASSDGDVGDEHHVEAKLLFRHLGEVEVAHTLVVVRPLSLRATLQSLIAIKLDGLIKILGVHTAMLRITQPSRCYIPFQGLGDPQPLLGVRWGKEARILPCSRNARLQS